MCHSLGSRPHCGVGLRPGVWFSAGTPRESRQHADELAYDTSSPSARCKRKNTRSARSRTKQLTLLIVLACNGEFIAAHVTVWRSAAFMPEVECTIHDFRSLRMKPDHAQNPFWVLPDSRIILESSSPVYKEAEALLIAIANPVSRTRFLQEYELKPDSLYAGASMGLTTADILNAMERFSKNELPPQVRELIHTETSRYGKVKVVTRSHQLFIECRNYQKCSRSSCGSTLGTIGPCCSCRAASCE